MNGHGQGPPGNGDADSSGLLDDLLELPVITWRLNAANECLSIEGKGLEYLQLGPEDFVGRNVLEMFPDLDSLEEVLLRVRHGETVRHRFSLDNLLIDSIVRPRKDPTGRIVGLRGVAHVISVEQQTSHRIHQLQERFQTLFHSCPAALSVQSWPEGRFLKVNRALEEMSGLPAIEMIGKTSSDLGLYLRPDDREKIFEELRVNGIVRNVEVPYRPRGGEEGWLLATLQLTECDGEQCMLTATINITELKRAQQEEQRLRERLLKQEEEARKLAEQFRQESDARWTGLTESSPEFILVVDQDRRIQWINRTQPDLTRDQVIGQPVMNFIPRDVQSEPEDVIEHVFKTGKPHIHEVQARGPNGTVSWFLSRIGPIFQNGVVDGLIVVASDITEQKLARERDRNLRDKLMQMNRVYLETAASSMIVHEISNRLASLRNRTCTWLNYADRQPENVPEELRNGISRMRDDFQALADFLRHQRKFLEHGELSFSTVSICSLLKDASRFVEDQALDAGVAVLVQSPGAPAEIECDSVQIQQVLMNLLLNSISALKKLPEGQTRCVELSAEPVADGKLMFQVSDTGPGWPPGFDLNQKKIRESTADGGLGLGLEISRMIVEAHHGQLKALPAADGGAMVQVILPATQK